MRHDYHHVSIFHYRIRTNKVPFLHPFLRHPIKDNYYETLLLTFSSPLLVDNKFFL